MGFNRNSIKKILIIKYAAIGDLLMATPVFRALRRAYPKAKIALLVGKWSLPAVENNPNIDEFVVVDDCVFAKKKSTEALALAVGLRRRKFDLVISLHRSLLMSLFTYLIGKKYRLGFDRGNEGMFYNIKLSYKHVKNLHESAKFAELVSLVGVKTDNLRYDFCPKKIDAKKAKALANEKIGGRFVVFVPGGGENPAVRYESKRWPKENWIKLGKLLERDGIKVVLVGSRSEKKDCCEVAQGLGKGAVVDFCGILSLGEVAALLRHTAALVTPDTALMHLGAATGIRTFALFGPTDPKQYAPPDVHIIKSEVPCAPCYTVEGRFPKCVDNICMKAIKPMQVYKSIKRSLRGGEAREHR